LCDALGNLVRFELLRGNRYDTIGVAPLIDTIEFGATRHSMPTGSSKN